MEPRPHTLTVASFLELTDSRVSRLPKITERNILACISDIFWKNGSAISFRQNGSQYLEEGNIFNVKIFNEQETTTVNGKNEETRSMERDQPGGPVMFLDCQVSYLSSPSSIV